jgi:hypothetical protein
MILDVLGKEDDDLFESFTARISLLSAQYGVNWRNLICDMK